MHLPCARSVHAAGALPPFHLEFSQPWPNAAENRPRRIRLFRKLIDGEFNDSADFAGKVNFDAWNPANHRFVEFQARMC